MDISSLEAKRATLVTQLDNLVQSYNQTGINMNRTSGAIAQLDELITEAKDDAATDAAVDSIAAGEVTAA